MSTTKKRKLVQSSDTDSDPVCIIHSQSSNHNHFTSCSYETFQKLEEIKQRRLAEPTGSPYRMSDICFLFPSSFAHHFGYHRDCYQNFTKNADRLTAWKKDQPSTVEGPSQVKRRRSKEPDRILFTPDCIFCGKKGRKRVSKKGRIVSEQISRFEFGGGDTVQRVAEEKNDEMLLTRIRGVDLFACEAMFHNSCRNKYTSDPDRWRSKNQDRKKKQEDLETDHRTALDKIDSYISEEIFQKGKVLKLTDLREMYVSELEKTDNPNPEYRAENLKLSLQKRHPNNLRFIEMKTSGKYSSSLVFSADTDIESAVRCSFILGSVDKVVDTAKSIRNDILSSFEQQDPLLWPTTANYLDNRSVDLPISLDSLLSTLLVGKERNTSSLRVRRLVSSIGQDICRAVTNGRWKFKKHILLCMTLRNWFRSAELSTLMNRLGHAESYSFSLELETAIALAVENTSTLLSPQIVRHPDVPAIFHSDFDNYDQLLNDLHGMASIHTSHGIMLQDFDCPADADIGGHLPNVSSLDKTGIRSLKLETHDVLPECYITKHKTGPSYRVQISEIQESVEVFDTESKSNLLWVISRYFSSLDIQTIPGFLGWQTLLGDKPPRLTTVDYYPVINQPITDNKTVQECLRFSEEASKEVGQAYVVTTFDLGVCMKAYPIIWSQPSKYKNHIVMMGSFHTICAYLKMIGKKMEGSGLSDILLEAGLIGSDSINGVMSGKHYSRAMNCHKLMLEALERLLYEQFRNVIEADESTTFVPDKTNPLVKNLMEDPTKDNFDAAFQNEEIGDYIDKYITFRQEVRDGEHGKTAQLWMTYMDHIWLVLQLTKAVKRNNYLLYGRCLFLMCDLFFSFGGQNYARFLTFFSVFLANLDSSHPGASQLLSRGGFSVARSWIPGNRCAVDKTIEETFMKHSKSHGGAGGSSAGLTGLAGNYEAYQRWIRAAHERSRFVSSTLKMADMSPDMTSDGHHRDLRPSEIKRGDVGVNKVMETIIGFINPFAVDDKDKLICLSSGAVASSTIEEDVLQSEKKGAAAKSTFIQERLVDKTVSFFEPIKRLNLKTLSELTKKTTVKSSKNKVLVYRQQSNIAFQLLVRSQKDDMKINLQELMTYPLTPIPYSIGTSDGFLTYTDKSKGFHHLVKDVKDCSPPPEDKTLVIHDGNAIFHSLKDLPSTFKDICSKILDLVLQKSDVVFSTDMYLEYSVKSMERMRRGDSEKLILKGENTRKPPDWQKFLSNDENKRQLIEMLCRVWKDDSYSRKLHNRKLILICEGHAYLITEEDGKVNSQEIESLCSTQEETDSRVILYCLYGKEQGYKYIRVKSPDTDIFFILLYYASELTEMTILFDTGIRNKRLINISSLADQFENKYGPEYCTALLGLHAFTKCDSTSAFKSIGKIKPITVLQKNLSYINALSELGTVWEVGDDVVEQLEAFTCLIYGGKHFTDVNEMRYSKIRSKCCGTPGKMFDSSRNFDMSSLPPCRKCLLQHIKRANYQVAIWKRAHYAKPTYADPADDHGWQQGDGVLEPKWIDGDFLPQSLIDVLVEDDLMESESEEEYDGESEVLYSVYESDSDDD